MIMFHKNKKKGMEIGIAAFFAVFLAVIVGLFMFVAFNQQSQYLGKIKECPDRDNWQNYTGYHLTTSCPLPYCVCCQINQRTETGSSSTFRWLAGVDCDMTVKDGYWQGPSILFGEYEGQEFEAYPTNPDLCGPLWIRPEQANDITWEDITRTTIIPNLQKLSFRRFPICEIPESYNINPNTGEKVL